MPILERLRRRSAEARSSDTFTYAGNTYPLSGYGYGYGALLPNVIGNLSARRPTIANNLEAIHAATAQASVVGSCVAARSLVMSQVYPTWRDLNTRGMFRNNSLRWFEDRRLPRLLMEWEVHACLTGNVYVWRDDRRQRLKTMRADWVHLVLGTMANPTEIEAMSADLTAMDIAAGERAGSIAHALDAEVIGYIYQPPGHEPEYLPAADVAHWVAEPHPLSPWLGESPVTGCAREIAAEHQVDVHIDRFFEHGATPHLVVSYDKDVTPERAAEYRDLLEDEIAGGINAWRAIYLGGGTDVTVVGSRLGDLGLPEFRGKMETRIAARLRVPATIAGISEGMQGSALNAGNYGQTRRMWADGWFTPHADGLTAALQHIVEVPDRGFLSWDPSAVPFLQEDEKDAAEIYAADSQSIRTLTDGGYEPGSVVASTKARDHSLLEHTGLLPVQVQEPGTTNDNADAGGDTNATD